MIIAADDRPKAFWKWFIAECVIDPETTRHGAPRPLLAISICGSPQIGETCPTLQTLEQIGAMKRSAPTFDVEIVPTRVKVADEKHRNLTGPRYFVHALAEEWLLQFPLGKMTREHPESGMYLGKKQLTKLRNSWGDSLRLGELLSAVCSRIAHSDQKRPWCSYLLPAGEGAPQGRMRAERLALARKSPHPAVPARPRKRGSPRSPREKERRPRRACNSTVKCANLLRVGGH